MIGLGRHGRTIIGATFHTGGADKLFKLPVTKPVRTLYSDMTPVESVQRVNSMRFLIESAPCGVQEEGEKKLA